MAQRPLPCSRAPGPATSVGGIPPTPRACARPSTAQGLLRGLTPWVQQASVDGSAPHVSRPLTVRTASGRGRCMQA